MTQVLERIRNGDSAQIYSTLDAIKENPALGIFQFRAQNRWLDGAHVDADKPANPNPAEYLLHALAACLTTTLVHTATARNIVLTEVTSTLEGDMDVRGCLGLSDDVPNGFTDIRVNFTVTGDAPPEKLRELVERVQARSVVFDMVHSGVPVDITVEA
jgi:uncharacterized OsmC-like protein